MSREQLPIGFFAIWDSKRSEYHAGAEEEKATCDQIQRAFQIAEKKGARICKHYYCRWSAERKTFTFWVCPNFDVLDSAMDDLYAAGDFKFAESEHILGVSSADSRIDDDSFDYLGKYPYGFFAAWKWKDSYYRASEEEKAAYNRAVEKVFDYARGQGVRMFGVYDCHFSSQWDHFTFWLSPSFETIEDVMNELEAAGDFKFAESRHLVGVLEDGNRFGRHLQAP